MKEKDGVKSVVKSRWDELLSMVVYIRLRIETTVLMAIFAAFNCEAYCSADSGWISRALLKVLQIK